MKVKLYDDVIRNFKVAKVFRQNTDQVKVISFSPDGEQLITCDWDDVISIYNCEMGIQTGLFNSKKYGVDLIRFVNDCTAIHSSTKIDDKIRFMNLDTIQYYQYFTGHSKRVVSLAVSPNNSTFLSTSLDNTLRMWDLRLPDCQNVMHFSGRPTTTYDPDGLIFAVGVNSRCIKLYDTRAFSKGPFSTFKVNRDKECDWIALKFSNDGKVILVNTNGSVTQLIDAFFGTQLQSLTGKIKYFPTQRKDREVNQIPSTGYDNNERIPIESSFSPDSRFVFSGSSDGRIHVWNATSGYKVCVLNGGHPAPVQCVQFNPKYVMLSSACSDVAFWLPIDL